jgi:hypothetical protein
MTPIAEVPSQNIPTGRSPVPDDRRLEKMNPSPTHVDYIRPVFWIVLSMAPIVSGFVGALIGRAADRRAIRVSSPAGQLPANAERIEKAA